MNEKFIKFLVLEPRVSHQMTFRKGSILRVAKYFIKPHNEQYSVHFNVIAIPDFLMYQWVEPLTFWAHLKDVNQMEIEDHPAQPLQGVMSSEQVARIVDVEGMHEYR
jgi:hypothetical protein